MLNTPTGLHGIFKQPVHHAWFDTFSTFESYFRFHHQQPDLLGLVEARQGVCQVCVCRNRMEETSLTPSHTLSSLLTISSCKIETSYVTSLVITLNEWTSRQRKINRPTSLFTQGTVSKTIAVSFKLSLGKFINATCF